MAMQSDFFLLVYSLVCLTSDSCRMKKISEYRMSKICRAPLLNTVLFHSYLCINSKVLQKKFFDWAFIREDTIVLRTLSIRRTKNFQQAR
jgi:hypothetical protein